MKDSVRQVIEAVTKSGQNVHRPMTLFFSTLFFITFVSVIWFSIRFTNGIFNQLVDEQILEVERYYELQLQDQIKLQELVVIGLLNDEAVIETVRDKRNFDKVNGIFATLTSYNITHLYIYSPTREVIHRAHSINRKGDVINRSNLLVAEQEKRMVTGLELGNVGAFTLRSSSPVFVNRQLIGYIEVGMELGHVLERTEQQFNVKLYEFFKKEVATKNRAKLYPLADRKTDRDSNEKYIINAAQGASFEPQQINRILKAAGKKSHELIVEKQAIKALPMRSFSGELVGFMAIVADVSKLYQQRNYDMSKIILIALSLGIFSLIAINMVLRYLESSIINFSERQRDSERELKQSLKRLKDTQELIIEREKFASLGSMVAGIAHEVNTPLGISLTAATAINHELDKLEKALDDKTLTPKMLAKLSGNLRDLSSLINNNLHRSADLVQSFKQVAVDQSSDQFRKVNFAELLHEIVTSFTPQLKKQHHKAVVHCSDDLVIKTVPGNWSQILFNLINNSLIHGFEDMEDGTITISVTQESGLLTLLYQDNGKGISSKNKRKIFEPFFTTKRNDGGSGLGMHLVFNIVTQGLKGNIELEDNDVPGVCFRISLMLT